MTARAELCAVCNSPITFDDVFGWLHEDAPDGQSFHHQAETKGDKPRKSLTSEAESRCGECGGELVLHCTDCGTRHGSKGREQTMSEPTINETDEPVDPVSAVTYWRERWAASASAHVDALTVADHLADCLRSANAVIERMRDAQFNPAILDRIREALEEHRDLIGMP